MDNFSVTVAVPCYNGDKFLSENLSSIISQTRKPDEIFLIDDGSTDRSVEIAKSFPDVKIVQHQSNKGLAAARNTAIINASGDILIYLDADTKADVKLIENILKEYSEDEIAGVGGREMKMNNYSQINTRNIYNHWRNLHASQSFGESRIIGVNMLWGLCSSYRKKILQMVGGFDPVYKTNGEDVDIGIKITRLGLKLVYTPNAIVYHGRSDDFDSLKKMLYQWHFWGYIAKIRNNYPAFFPHLRIIISNLIKNISYDLIVQKNPYLAFLSLKAAGIKLKATFNALLSRHDSNFYNKGS